MNAESIYSIDQNGIDGRWRVFWVRQDGYGTELLFDSREAAERWVEYVESA